MGYFNNGYELYGTSSYVGIHSRSSLIMLHTANCLKTHRHTRMREKITNGLKSLLPRGFLGSLVPLLVTNQTACGVSLLS
jgi:hypothetical protein